MSSLLQSVTCHGKKNKLTRNPEQQRRDMLLRCYLSGKELQFNIKNTRFQLHKNPIKYVKFVSLPESFSLLKHVHYSYIPDRLPRSFEILESFFVIKL